MNGVYKIASIKFRTGSKRGEEKTDDYSKKRIGRTIRITEENEPKAGQCAYLPYVKDADGNDLSWNAMITSYVTKVDEKDDVVILETQNSVYEFEKVVE